MRVERLGPEEPGVASEEADVERDDRSKGADDEPRLDASDPAGADQEADPRPSYADSRPLSER